MAIKQEMGGGFYPNSEMKNKKITLLYGCRCTEGYIFFGYFQWNCVSVTVLVVEIKVNGGMD